MCSGGGLRGQDETDGVSECMCWGMDERDGVSP